VGWNLKSIIQGVEEASRIEIVFLRVYWEPIRLYQVVSVVKSVCALKTSEKKGEKWHKKIWTE